MRVPFRIVKFLSLGLVLCSPMIGFGEPDFPDDLPDIIDFPGDLPDSPPDAPSVPHVPNGPQIFAEISYWTDPDYEWDTWIEAVCIVPVGRTMQIQLSNDLKTWLNVADPFVSEAPGITPVFYPLVEGRDQTVFFRVIMLD